jgi:peptidoglycan hydrolase-like protein with peptidoglycan-binding domain
LNSEGLTLGEIPSIFPEVLQEGDSGAAIRELQYYLSYVAQYVDSVTPAAIDGIFGPETRRSVISFQRTYGLTPDGIVGPATWNLLYNTYRGMLTGVDIAYREGTVIPFPGQALTRGDEGEDVRVLQEYLSYLSRYIPGLPPITADGVFGPATERAVRAFQSIFLPSFVSGVVGAGTWAAITEAYTDVYVSNQVNEGQYPGYPIS